MLDATPSERVLLEEDEFHMLWLIHRNRRNSGRVQILSSVDLIDRDQAEIFSMAIRHYRDEIRLVLRPRATRH